MGCKLSNNFYWLFFISLEKDLLEISRYVEIHEENYQTYSIEFHKLLLASCSEFEALVKKLAKLHGKKVKNMKDFRSFLVKKYPDLLTLEVFLPMYDLFYKPFQYKNNEGHFIWWSAYDNIKHDINNNYNNANLENVLYSLSALYLLCLYYYKEVFQQRQKKDIDMSEVTINLAPRPQLFRVHDASFYELENAAYLS